jgi:hypothetical protein
MGLTFNQIVGQLPLGQQGIGGNLFTLYIDVIKQQGGAEEFTFGI